MSMTKREARRLLNEHGLRETLPRIAVLRVLAAAPGPLSHSEVVEQLGKVEWDQATTFRNLVKLRDAGVAPVVSRIDGIDRYALKSSPGDAHRHPHFSCEECGRVVCLPEQVMQPRSQPGAWSASIEAARITLQGECPDCLARSDSTA